MKSYKFEVTLQEGSDEFWEEATKGGKTGCDEVVDLVKRCFADYGMIDPNEIFIKLVEYKNGGDV